MRKLDRVLAWLPLALVLACGVLALLAVAMRSGSGHAGGVDVILPSPARDLSLGERRQLETLLALGERARALAGSPALAGEEGRGAAARQAALALEELEQQARMVLLPQAGRLAGCVAEVRAGLEAYARGDAAGLGRVSTGTICLAGVEAEIREVLGVEDAR